MSNWLGAAFTGVAIAFGIGCSTASATDGYQTEGIYTTTWGRLAASVAVMAGLIGTVLSGLTLRAAWRIRTGSLRLRASVGLVAALGGMTLGGLVVATASGGIGTGNGLGGGVVALIVGLIGVALSGLALARSHRRERGQFSPIPVTPPPQE